LYTRCPACEALYELSPQELAEAAGVVRCSNCGKTFNSLANLFDQQPELEDRPLRGQGMPPLLGNRILLQHGLPGFDQRPPSLPPLAAESAVELPPIEAPTLPQPTKTLVWPAIIALLAVLAIAQAMWLLKLPERWLESSAKPPMHVDPGSAVALVGRDMHAHPSRPDAVVINALLRNQSASTIDFPVIELRLFDRSGQILGARRLPPDDYLPDPAGAPNGLAPGTLLPLIIEVAVTASEPAGFELRFL